MLANFNNLDARSVPTGAVMAFNLATCPTNWSLADGNGGRPDLRGEFIRGLDGGRGIDSGRTLASSQSGSIISGQASATANVVSINISTSTNLGWENVSSGIASGVNLAYIAGTSTMAGTTNIGYVRPHNVAFIYCIKN